ncbi:MAG: MerC family mercury resistance protein [Deltaproteobacteria bacterium]|nr:MerC family mercury resistance protein [Deltaproteobacteria bacterium]
MSGGTKARNRLDVAGLLLSGSCALHCLFVALAPALLAATGLGALLDETAEWVFTITAVAVGAIAATLALRAGRSRIVVAAFVVSIGLLLVGRGFEHAGVHGGVEVFSALGGVGLALAHVVNLRGGAAH